jgi:hypothetical protein
MPVTNTDGYDANGRPDELLKRITYDTSIWQHAFLFADGEATAGVLCTPPPPPIGRRSDAQTRA